MEPFNEGDRNDIYNKVIEDMNNEVYSPSCSIDGYEVCESCQ